GSLSPPRSEAPPRPSHRPGAISSFAPRASQPPRRGSSPSLPLPAQGRVKGTAIRAGLVWVTQRYGHDFFVRIVEGASPDLQTMLRLDDPGYGVVASGWYDTLKVGELLLVVEEALGFDDETESDSYNNALASAIAKDNVGGVYKSLFRLITTPSMLE